MHPMSIAGRRAEVLWRSGSFLTGKGLQRTFDTFVVRFGFMAPFALAGPFHVWDLPAIRGGGPCKGVRLRPDPAFKRRVFLYRWAVIGAPALVLVAAFVWDRANPTKGFLALACSIAVAMVGVLAWRERSRDRSIRLLLGLHEWGSSDPATWAQELIEEIVDPKEALGCESFAALSRHAHAECRWGEAIWAARLCVAAEDPQEGETLTDAVLQHPEVIRGLRRVRRKPKLREEEFGDVPPLGRWIARDLEEYICAIE